MGVRSRILGVWIRRTAAAAVLAAAAGLTALWLVPFPEEVLDRPPAGRRVLDREGRVLRDTLAPGDLRARPLPVGAFGDWAEKAIIAAEDKRFRTHPGVDVLALLRAVGQNLGSLRVVSGASTLSTQVIRLMEPRPRTLSTKLVEAFRALQMETRRNKDEILAHYLNRAPFGGNRTGLEAAALSWFGKSARDLTLGEAALLAGLPQAPSRFRPDRHLDAALKRRVFVFDRMESLGFITAGQRRDAEAQPLTLRAATSPFAAPHWCDERLRDSAASDIHSTLDARLQGLAEQALADSASILSSRGVHGGAIVIVDVRTSAIRAMVGSPSYADSRRQGQVNGATAPRSAGSTLKPFLYALAVDRGRLAPGWMLADVPRNYAGYRPENAARTFHGLVRADESLVLSLNLPALQLTQDIGTAPLLDTLRQLGLQTLADTPERYGIGLALGTGSVRLTDLAGAYACLARGGLWMPLRTEETAPPARGVRVFSETAAWMLATMLGGEERALAFYGSLSDARLPRVAWKTGTSNGLRDAWTLSWNPDYVVGVWLGNPDGSGTDALQGIENAAPIAGRIWRRLYDGSAAPWYADPPGLATVPVCGVSGRPRGPCCPASPATGLTVAGVTDPAPCTVHRRGPGGRVVEAWPPEVADWLAGNGPGGGQVTSSTWRVVTPREGTVYHRIDLPGGNGSRLSFAAEGAAGRLHWFLNGSPVDPDDWALQPGRHTLACADDTGRRQVVRFRVE